MSDHPQRRDPHIRQQKEKDKTSMKSPSQILVTGGAGYVGSVLVPKLLAANHRVKVLDLYLYGAHVLDCVRGDPGLEQIRGDLRDREVLKQSLVGCDAVIHLACVSNDPSFELNPELGKSINYDAFRPLVEIARDSGVRRFIYASTSSVYGIKEEENVSEELPLKPLTDYSKYKALCEDILHEYQDRDFTTVTIRPATVCGYSPRLRLDLTVNILTNHALNRGTITVFGGEQKRPNIHIDDLTDLYVDLVTRPDRQIAGQVWNAGYENHRVSEIAEMVRQVVGPERVNVVTSPTDDLRSYHISSEKIRRDLSFAAKRTLQDAIRDLTGAFRAGKVPNSMDDIRYYNVKTMQAVKLH
jgi:nucleoside-diphosphate-sugar epimerase